MILDYIGVNEVSGSLVVLDDVENASYEEVVDIRLDDGSRRTGRIVQLDGKRAVVQVFEGTRGISLENTRTRLRGGPLEIPLSPVPAGRSMGWERFSPTNSAILTERQLTLFRAFTRKIISAPAFRVLMC